MFGLSKLRLGERTKDVIITSAIALVTGIALIRHVILFMTD